VADVPVFMKNTLRSLRTKLGYSQKAAAKLLDISVTTLRSWERDSSKITYADIKRIENIYNISSDYIFFGKELAISELLRKKDKTA
jgi:transcriptional regulator with XRE-family HTH domain